MRRFQTIQDRDSAEMDCDHRTISEWCSGCGGLLARYCQYCGKEFDAPTGQENEICYCQEPEPVERM